MMQMIFKKRTIIRNWMESSILLIKNEFSHNFLSFILPIPIYLCLLGYILLTGQKPVNIGVNGTWIFITFGILLAMIYGLQCFSGDSDKKTLDFILTRPVSIPNIVLIKYFSGLSVLGIWIYLFWQSIMLDLSQLPLPKGIGPEWIILLILIVYSMSMFSGLLAKGLERFFVVIVLTGAMSYLSYFLWSKLFYLITANYYWYDIPPYQMKFITTYFPLFLTLVSLITAITATIWQLRSRIPVWRFNLAKTTIFLWLLTSIIVFLTEYLLAPPLWPISNAKFGDWHSSKGIVIVNPVESQYEFRRIRQGENVQFQLKLSKLGRKPKTIYAGINLAHPRFSPDGKSILFSEQNILKIINTKNKKIKQLGPGYFGTWSADGTKLIYAKTIGKKGLSSLFIRDLKTGTKKIVTPHHYELADIIWDSQKKQLYLIGFATNIKRLDLSTGKIFEYSYQKEEKPSSYFGFFAPAVTLDNNTHNLFIAQVLQEDLCIYMISPEQEKIELQEKFSNFRLKTGAILLLNNDLTSFLWPRIDGTFGFQATKLYIGKEHALSHHHEHDHDEHDDHDEHEDTE